jgi:hypothetical protein
MKIEKWFNELKEREPYWSDLTIFNTCITDRSLTKGEIGKAFNKLVHKDEYVGVDKDDLLEFCYSLVAKK